MNPGEMMLAVLAVTLGVVAFIIGRKEIRNLCRKELIA